jgi:hypothetical protein
MLALKVVAALTLSVIRAELPDLVWLLPPPATVSVPLLSDDPVAVSVVSGSQLMDWVAVVVTGTGCPLGCGPTAGPLLGGGVAGLPVVLRWATVWVAAGCCAVVPPPTVTVATAATVGRPLAVAGRAGGCVGAWVGDDAGLTRAVELPRWFALVGDSCVGAAAG